MLEKILRSIEKIIPKKVYSFFQPYYHFLLALLGAIIYRFPSSKLIVIGVTGTKGKSTTTQMIYEILKNSGKKCALINTIEFRIGEKRERNYFKMTTPGRFFLQKFLRKAVSEGCTHAVIEISSESTLQYRHRFLYLDGFVFTNLSPEHIERHGSYENYRNAKVEIAKRCASSGKEKRILVANKDDKETPYFRIAGFTKEILFSLNDVKPIKQNGDETTFSWRGHDISLHVLGIFNVENALAALETSRAFGIDTKNASEAMSAFNGSQGRMQTMSEGQNFKVIVDYAHTPDSIQKVLETFAGKRRIVVFGATGGGRDKWKRSEMGKVASANADEIILTNDDPYDEDPQKIIEDILKGVSINKVRTILDRRLAIREALKSANRDSVVLILGKGTDPYLMEANGKKTPWSDEDVVTQELKGVLKNHS